MDIPQGARLTIDRKRHLGFGPGVAEWLTEAPQNSFSVKTRADSATIDRMSFTMRSPSSGLLCSPKAYVEFELDIKQNQPVSTFTQSQAGYGLGYAADGVDDGALADGTNKAAGRTPLLCFPEYDGVGACLQHSSVTINGSSITVPSCNLWWRSFLRCSIDDQQAQQVYSGCGGPGDRYDCVAGKAYNGGVTTSVLGADSGVMQRARNFTCQTVSTTGGTRGMRRVRIVWPILGGLFNPLTGLKLNATNPYHGAAYGLANQNQISADFLFSGLGEYLIRSLSQATGTNYSNHGVANDKIEIKLVEDQTFMYVKYYRLAAGREIPATQRVNTWKSLLSIGPSMPSVANAAQHVAAMADNANTQAVFSNHKLTYFPAIGRDFQTVAGREVENSDSSYTITFENVAFPMPPSAIMICGQQEQDSYANIVTPTVDRSAQGRDCNLSIRAIEITVNTSEKVIHYSADATNQRDRRRLFEATSRSCSRDNHQFFKGDINAWSDRNCVIYLTSDEWLPLSISPGMLVPITMSVKVKFQNRCAFMDGINVVTGDVIQLAETRMRSQPVMVAFYKRAVATVASATMVLGLQQVSLKSGQEQLAQNR